MAMNPPPPNPNLYPPPSDLPTALTTLRRLITAATTSLSPFPTTNTSNPPTLPRSLTADLRYPKTIHSSKDPVNQTSLELDPGGAELCFSFDEYVDFGPSFFYKDCPGPVSLVEFDPASRTFTLPRTLSIECANFSGGDNDKVIKMGSWVKENNIRFLPSELWFIRTETEGWNDCPASYSYNVLRAILCSLVIHEIELPGWVFSNSHHHGIVIDEPMRDHIVLLFQLCLKAIVREAVNWAELVLIQVKNKLNPVTMSFHCPYLIVAMKWLSSQLSVLYKEMHGKSFAMNMLKQWILDSSKSMSLFMVQNVDASTVSNKKEGESVEPLRKRVDSDKNSVMDKSVNWETIFVSQVAAAVAALHERAFLEEKLKVLQDPKLVPKYQRVAEHAYLSYRADEERKSRTNYRPLLEHDGIVWQRRSDQEGNTTKTREQLLAEERDYKRRRASYRGKKSNRNATEVMRDIIEDCMDSIRQAGGIGCLAKVSDEAGKLFSEPSPSDFGGFNKNMSTSSTVTSDLFNGHKEQFQSLDDSRSTRFKDKPLDDPKQYSRDSSRYYEHHEDQRTADRDRHSRDHYSSRLERDRSQGSRYRDDKAQRERSHESRYRDDKYQREGSHESRYRDGKDQREGSHGSRYRDDKDQRERSHDSRYRDDKDQRERSHESRYRDDKDHRERSHESRYRDDKDQRERSHESRYRDDKDHSRRKHHRVLDYGDNSSNEKLIYQRERANRDSEEKDRRRKHSKRDDRADSVTSCVLEDRYDPYESRDMYEG